MRSQTRVPLGLAVYISTALVITGTSVVDTYIPLYLRSFGASYFIAGLPLATQGVGRVLFDLGAGALSLVATSRTIILSGLGVIAAASLVLAAVPSVPLVIGIYTIVGAGMAMFHLSARKVVFEAAPERERGRAVGTLSTMIALGAVIGPAMGGFVWEAAGFSPLFLLTALSAGLAAAFALRVPREESPLRHGKKPNAFFSEALRLFAIPGFLILCTCTFWVFSFRKIRDLAVLFFAAEVMTLSPSQIGLVRTISTVGNMAGRYAGGVFTDRFGSRKIIAWGLVLVVPTLFFVTRSVSFLTLLLPLTLISFGSGMVNVASQTHAMGLIESKERGLAIAVYRIFGDAGEIVGPFLVAVMLDHVGYDISFVLMSVLSFCLLLWVISSAQLQNRKETTEVQPPQAAR